MLLLWLLRLLVRIIILLSLVLIAPFLRRWLEFEMLSRLYTARSSCDMFFNEVRPGVSSPFIRRQMMTWISLDHFIRFTYLFLFRFVFVASGSIRFSCCIWSENVRALQLLRSVKNDSLHVFFFTSNSWLSHSRLPCLQKCLITNTRVVKIAAFCVHVVFHWFRSSSLEFGNVCTHRQKCPGVAYSKRITR